METAARISDTPQNLNSTQLHSQKKYSLLNNKFQYLFGVLLLLLIPVWIFVLAPYFLRLPEDYTVAYEVVSQDDFYDEAIDSYEGPIFSKTTFSYEALATEGKTTLIRNTFDVRTFEDDPIFSVQRLYAIDRNTYAHVSEKGDEPRSGFLFAPRRLQKGESYVYWHINYNAPAVMRYVDAEQIEGLTVYKYEADYSESRIDQTENLAYLPGVGTSRGVELEPTLTVWVEPVSGQLIDYKDDTVAYYYDLSTEERLHPWNHFSNTISVQNVQTNVREANYQKTLYYLVSFIVPLILGVLALYLFVSASSFIKLYRVLSNKLVIGGIGSVIFVVSTIVLLGWIVGNANLINIASFKAAMNPLTSASFLILGLVILTYNVLPRSIIRLLGGVLVVVAFIRLLGEFAIPFQIDLVYFKDAIYSFGVPARMSSYTAISFFLLGLSLLISVSGRLKKILFAEIFIVNTFVFSIVSLAIILFDRLTDIHLPFFFSASFMTTIFFMIASVALYILYRGRFSALTVGGRLFLGVMLSLSIILTVTATGLFEQYFVRERVVLFEGEVADLSENISNRVNIYTNTLAGVRGLLNASEQVDRDEWRTYVESLKIEENYPGIQGIGYSIFIEPDELDQHIQQIRDEGFTGYRVYPEGERDLYTAIVYLEPFDVRNQQAFGFDMYQESVRKNAMSQARDTGKPRISGKITLVQEIDEDVQPGFLIYVPVYEGKVTPDTVDGRRQKILGYVYSPFRARNFIEGAIDRGVEEISLTIYDGAKIDKDAILYDDSNQKLNDELGISFSETRTLYVSGRPWTIVFTSSDSYGEEFFSAVGSFIIIFLGILISTLIASVSYSFLVARQEAIKYADSLTVDLRSAKERLEAKLKETERLNSVMVGRELKMIELKKRIKELEKDNDA